MGRFASMACCASCWDERHPDRPVRDDQPRGQADPDTCCYCGAETRDGIYVRGDVTVVAHPPS